MGSALAHPKPEKRGPKPPRRIARRARPRPYRRTETAALKRQARALWRRLIKQRDGYRCQSCPALGTDAAHVYPVGAYPCAQLWLDNGVTLCNACHRRFGSTGKRWFSWAAEWMGRERFRDLTWRAIDGRLDVRAELEILRMRAA